MDDSPRIPAIPVVCSACRTALAEDAPEHEAIAELLSFDPVPVRAHSNNWTPAHQRGFIAALAITGSVNKAARAVGRFPFGAERLRKARGGTSFAMAWE